MVSLPSPSVHATAPAVTDPPSGQVELAAYYLLPAIRVATDPESALNYRNDGLLAVFADLVTLEFTATASFGRLLRDQPLAFKAFFSTQLSRVLGSFGTWNPQDMLVGFTSFSASLQRSWLTFVFPS